MALTLSQVDDAIAKVLGGQSWTANGVTYTRANLAELQDLRNTLKLEQGLDGSGRKMFTRGRLMR